MPNNTRPVHYRNGRNYSGYTSGGGGGHTILNESGTEMSQRSKLQFEGATVSDDSTNDVTVVETVNPVDYEEDIHGVNLIPYPYHHSNGYKKNGITFTVNADGSVTANGTATANADFACAARSTDAGIDLKAGERYTLSGCPSGGNNSKYYFWINETINGESSNIAIDYGEKATFTLDTVSETFYGIGVRIASGQTVSNLTFKPMLYKADLDIDDNEYIPYNAQAIQHQLNAQGILGAKNLIPYPYNQTTETVSGITFTDNGDGSITVNGTATADVFMTLFSQSGSNFILPKGSYTGSGCPSGGSDSTYQIRFQRVSSTTYMYKDKGNGVDFEFTEAQQCGVYIFIYSGATLSNVTFKPMLRLASDPDNTYVPYAMTNKELTNKVQDDLTAQYNSQTVPFKFGIDSNGNYGYIKAGADSVTPFKNPTGTKSITSNGTYDVTDFASASVNVAAIPTYVYTIGNGKEYSFSSYDRGVEKSIGTLSLNRALSLATTANFFISSNSRAINTAFYASYYNSSNGLISKATLFDYGDIGSSGQEVDVNIPVNTKKIIFSFVVKPTISNSIKIRLNWRYSDSPSQNQTIKTILIDAPSRTNYTLSWS